jgi:hypothetical protein
LDTDDSLICRSFTILGWGSVGNLEEALDWLHSSIADNEMGLLGLSHAALCQATKRHTQRSSTRKAP